MRRLSFALLAIGLCLAGCKDKVKDTLLKYEPRFNAVRVVLLDAASDLPEPNAPVADLPLDPPVAWSGDAKGNTDIFSKEQLRGGMRLIDLGYPNELARGFQYVSATNPMTPDELKRPGESVIPELENMLARRYAVVYRTIERFAPTPAADGRADLDAFLIDLSSGQIKRKVRVLALARAGAPYEELMAEAHDALLEALAARTGGKFEIVHQRKRPAPTPTVVPPLNPITEDDLPPAGTNTAPIVVNLHFSPTEQLAAGVKQAADLLAKKKDPANVCRGVLTLARVESLDDTLAADLRRVCIRDASLFWAGAVAAKDCPRARALLVKAAGAPCFDEVAHRVDSACP